MSELKPCPCGKTPTKLHITDNGQGYKWGNATPDCCGEWGIEFRAVSYDFDSTETYQAAVKAWNHAPRGEK